MAHKRELARGFGKYDLPFLFDLDAAVGWHAANRRDDVMLVQALLNAVFGGESITFGQNTLSGNVPSLAVDGVFGPKTAFALTLFLICIGGTSVARIQPAGKPGFGDPLSELQLHAYAGGNSKFYEASFLNGKPAVLQHALKTTRKASR